MSAYRFTETHERYYPRLGLTARPGDVRDFDDQPPDDGRWEPHNPASKTKKPTDPKNEE